MSEKIPEKPLGTEEFSEAMARAVQSTRVVAPLLDEPTLMKVMEDMKAGNIPAMLYLIMHNQTVIDRKLNTLLEGKKPKADKKP